MEKESYFGRHAKEKDLRYCKVPNDLIRNKALSCEARVFVMWATSHDSSFVWTRKQAMEAIKVKSMTTFYKVVEELSEAKYLIKIDFINSSTSPASEIYMMYKVPHDSSQFRDWYDESEPAYSKEVGVPKNDTLLVPNFDTTPVPKNGTLKNTILEQPKENIKKENIKRKKAATEFVPPTIEMVKVFFRENGYSHQAAENAFHHYADKSWCDTYGNRVLNWKSKIRNNWFKDQYKLSESQISSDMDNPEQYEGFNKYRHYNEDVLKQLVDGIWHYQTRPIGFKKG